MNQHIFSKISVRVHIGEFITSSKLGHLRYIWQWSDDDDGDLKVRNNTPGNRHEVGGF